ncbi:MAG: radical SAM protein, partial [Bacteroidota bacterium]
MRILLVIPPLTQINTPYPSTAYLSGFLKGRGYAVDQVDLGIEMILLLFSSEGLKLVFGTSNDMLPNGQTSPSEDWSENAQWIFAQRERYISTIDRVIRFLQHKDPTLAYRINSGQFLPRAGRFEHMEDLELAFGLSGQQDKARYLATLYLEDLGDFITECIDPDFGFSRYADRIGMSASSFDPIEERLSQPMTLVQFFLRKALEEAIQAHQPSVVGFTVPFPGNLFGALWCGGYLARHYPGIQKILGGGFVNTELRNLQDPRIFDWVDYITVDDGEGPILRLLDHLEGKIDLDSLHRTFVRIDGHVQYLERDLAHIPQSEVGIPDYTGLPLDRYLSVVERSNPMHRLWSDGRWNKLTVAHGCYWKRCSFCDVSLDYIGRYEPSPASLLADRIEAILEATGESGFHFVDEAAPPKVLRDLALELIHRDLQISWWANIRFEKTFDADLCKLLAASGCIAVSGGLEVASDRLLELMEKGVSIRQVAKVTEAFTQAGIMVHAYLMYGFPTQSTQETIDSLEIVRQLFENGLIQSAFWHRFALTAHSPVGLNPEKYKVEIVGPEFQGFARNDLQHI